MRALEPLTDASGVVVLDQTRLPVARESITLRSLDAFCHAIRSMQVRGAPLIGVTGAYGLAIALRADPLCLDAAASALVETRPTAVNLAWAVRRVWEKVRAHAPADRAAAAWTEARRIHDEDAAACRAIGTNGWKYLKSLGLGASGRLPLATHCNAGWLATSDWGTALAPAYVAHAEGVDVHVWVSETRPRMQGLLTAWELGERGVAHTLVPDNAAGWLFSSGKVDACLVGADRIARNGDVCNKVGTVLKALAADAWRVPFVVAAPTSTIDPACPDGAAIPIEERSADEVRLTPRGDRLAEPGVPVRNPAFDVTPARYVTRLLTERGDFPGGFGGISGAIGIRP